MICRRYSFHKLIPFSQGNNVLDAPASHTDRCPYRVTCDFQLSSIGLFEAKRAYLPLETPKLNEVFL
jgi:hypothetical protein